MAISINRDRLVYTGLFVLTAVILALMSESDDPQGYKCKHGNAQGVCFKCWLEQHPE